jgi:hypothetical protein
MLSTSDTKELASYTDITKTTAVQIAIVIVISVYGYTDFA